MKETKKLEQYRLKRGYSYYFKGIGVDIGCGDDPLSQKAFKGITELTLYDKSLNAEYDATLCKELKRGHFDFVYSSHCLEHVDEPEIAIRVWISLCKRGGHIVFAVPHEVYYEKSRWPSLFNHEHKTSWTLEEKSNLPKSIHVPAFLTLVESLARIVSVETILLNYDFSNTQDDQTQTKAVCQIECILQRI